MSRWAGLLLESYLVSETRPDTSAWGCFFFPTLCCRSESGESPDSTAGALLFRDLNQYAPVLLFVSRGFFRRDERLGRPHPAGCARQFHSFGLERGADRFRASHGKFLIRLCGAVGIGMAFGRDMQFRDGRQRLGIARQDLQEPADSLCVAGSELRLPRLELELAVLDLLVRQGFVDLVEQRPFSQ